MADAFYYSIISVVIVSLVSFIGIATLSMQISRLKKILIYLVSFSAGALFGDAFIHLLPEIVEEAGFEFIISLYTLTGIAVFFVLEKVVQWHHYLLPHTKEQSHPFAIMNLVGDGVHNFIDGLIIGASYLAGIPVGIATTIAVIFHEIPQEVGDFGVLLHGGFKIKKAVLFNFLTAALAILGMMSA